MFHHSSLRSSPAGTTFDQQATAHEAQAGRMQLGRKEACQQHIMCIYGTKRSKVGPSLTL
jgi:hypothetical protein